MIVGMFGFRTKKLSVFPIREFDFTAYSVVKRYDTFFLQEYQTFFLDKKSERMFKFIENPCLANSQKKWTSINFWIVLKFRNVTCLLNIGVYSVD